MTCSWRKWRTSLTASTGRPSRNVLLMMANEFFVCAWPPRSRRSRGGDSMSERSLEGRVVLLTGGAGLLGRHYSRTLSCAGAKVVVADIDEAGAAAVVDAMPGS